MSWEDQGRQEHGWFGHGTVPAKMIAAARYSSERFAPTPAALDARIRSLGHCAICAMPKKLRQHQAASFPEQVMAHLTDAMRGWVRGLLLDRADFARRFFDRAANDPVVDHLWQATKFAALARGAADIRAGTEHLADAMQGVGLDRWRRFLADAQQKAASNLLIPVSDTTVRDYPAPYNPLGILVPGSPENEAWVRGADQVIGAAGAVLKRGFGAVFMNEGNDAEDEAGAAPGSTPNADPNGGVRKLPPLPANPDDMLAQGWRETTHPAAAAKGRRTFVDPETGQTIEFDKGRPGEFGFRGEDHYHVRSPRATGKRDYYLDKDGRPVPDGSKPSHIPQATRQEKTSELD